MSSESDGQSESADQSNAIEIVIEKLQEIVGDIQQKKQTVTVSTSKTENAAFITGPNSSTADNDERETSMVVISSNDGDRKAILLDNSEKIKNTTHINIVPITSTDSEASVESERVAQTSKSSPSGSNTAHEAVESTSSSKELSKSLDAANVKGTSVVITTQKGDHPSQVVLNFPIDAGEFNVKSTQGLIDTLLKLNSVLAKGKDSGQKSLFTYQKGGQMTTEVQLYKCAKCDYWSHNKYYLKQHVDLVHNAERVYKCPFCDYAGKRSHSLKEHLVVHSNYRPYVCSQCNASFRKKGHLTNHIKMHSQYKTGNLVCPICMGNSYENLLALHIHLRNKHPTEVYACDLCQYATFLNKGNITMHMLTHGSPKVYACTTCNFTSLHEKIMEEHVLEKHVDNVADSSTSASNSVETGKSNVASQHVVNMQECPKIWLKCSECGFSTDERQVLQYHMLSEHIAAFKGKYNLDTSQSVSDLSATLEENRDLNTSNNNVISSPQKMEDPSGTKPGTSGINVYKCSKCCYQNTHVASFIKHMLIHKPREKQAQKEKVDHKVSGLASKIVTQLASTSSVKSEPSGKGINVVIQKQQGDRSNENKCNQVAVNQPYTYDESNKWYQCTICGYSSELQRTIKAHIWKHSGHKDLDYPMFQNGPISMYELNPSGATKVVDKEKESDDLCPDILKTIGQVANKVIQNSLTSVDNGTAKLNAKPLPAAKTQHGQSQNVKSMKNTVPAKNVLYVKVPDDQVLDQKQFATQIPSILQQMNATEGEYVILQTQNNRVVNQLTIMVEKSHVIEKDKNLSIKSITDEQIVELIKSPPEEFNLKNEKISPNVVCKSELISIGSDVKDVTTVERNSDIDFGPSRKEQKATDDKAEVCEVIYMDLEDGHGGEEVIVEVIETVHQEEEVQVVVPKKENNITEKVMEGATSPELTYKRKYESGNEDFSSKKVCVDENKLMLPDEGVVVQDVNQVYSTSEIQMHQRHRFIHVKGEDNDILELNTPEMAAEVSVLSSQDREQIHERKMPLINRMMSTGTYSSTEEEVDDTGELDSQMSGSFDKNDAEVITLLSLLKKGPNFNPAYPVVNAKSMMDVSGHDDDEDSGDSFSSASQQKTGGISSSLLAVIEQLRERTSSGCNDGEGDASTAKGGALRPKEREKVIKAESILNIEALPDGTFRCLSCFYSHPSFEALRLHMRIHQDRQPYECSLCEYKGCSSEDLQDHMLKHCKLRTYQCKMCHSTFNYKSQLRAHMSAHPMSCNRCDYETSNASEFRNHVKLHEDTKKLYVCQKCGMTFHQKADAERHPSSCTGYGDKGNKKGGKRQYKCDYCPAVVHTQSVLKAHMRIHDVAQTLQCDLCGFLAFSVRSLKSHMKRHINDQRFVQQPLEQYKCNLCGYVCHHLPSLKSHMWRHSSDKNYNYEQINKIINRALEYDDEAGGESEENSAEQKKYTDSEGHRNFLIMFRCCQCGFETVHKSALNTHMKTHMDIIQKTLEVNQDRLIQVKGSIHSRNNDHLRVSGAAAAAAYGNEAADTDYAGVASTVNSADGLPASIVQVQLPVLQE